MSGTARLLETPAGIALGPLTLIAPGAARSFVVQLKAGRFHGFVVRRGGEVFGYVDRCPHMGLPLAKLLDEYLTPTGDLVMCSWHAALFEPETGQCVGGPCNGARPHTLAGSPARRIDHHGRVRRAKPAPAHVEPLAKGPSATMVVTALLLRACPVQEPRIAQAR